MKTIDILKPPSSLWLGRRGEENARTYAFLWERWHQDHPGATLSLIYTNPEGEQLIAATGTSSPVVWRPGLDTTVPSGFGSLECHLLERDDVIKISEPITTIIDDSASDAQQAAPAWVDQVVQAASHYPRPSATTGNWEVWDAKTEAWKDTGDSASGLPGASAYDLAVAQGYTGTLAEWLESLKGEQGEPGQDGADGADGAPGADGSDGVSPAVSIISIPGGHRVTISDEAHPLGQSFDVMDGEDGDFVLPAGGEAGQALLSDGEGGAEWGAGGGGSSADTPTIKAVLANIMTIIKAADEVTYNRDVSGLISQNDTMIDSLGGDTPAGAFSVTQTLVNVVNSNSSRSVQPGEAYNATITAKQGYELMTVTCTMDGVEQTVTNGVISIAAVTGNIVITAKAGLIAQTRQFQDTHTLTLYSDGGETASDIVPRGTRVIYGVDGSFAEDTEITIDWTMKSTSRPAAANCYHWLYVFNVDLDLYAANPTDAFSGYYAEAIYTHLTKETRSGSLTYTVKAGKHVAFGFNDSFTQVESLKVLI